MIILVTASERALLDTVRSRTAPGAISRAERRRNRRYPRRARHCGQGARRRARAARAWQPRACLRAGAGKEPPLKELLAALSTREPDRFRARAFDCAGILRHSRRRRGKFRANRAAARRNAMLQAARRPISPHFRPKAAETMALLAERIGVDALVTCIAAAVRARKRSKRWRIRACRPRIRGLSPHKRCGMISG